MKTLLFVALLLAISSSFSFKLASNVVEDDAFQKNNMADNCSQSRVSSVYAAIASCEQASESLTAVCILNTLHNGTNQKWDVFVKSSDVQAGVSYWYYSNCSIKLYNYGRFNRTYLVWSSESFNGQNGKKAPNLNTAPITTGNCTSSRVNSVNIALSSCQKPDETETTACIQNMIKTNLTEYWDAFSSRSSSASVQYWYSDQCNLIYSNYGVYNRTFIVWKAQ